MTIILIISALESNNGTTKRLILACFLQILNCCICFKMQDFRHLIKIKQSPLHYYLHFGAFYIFMACYLLVAFQVDSNKTDVLQKDGESDETGPLNGSDEFALAKEYNVYEEEEEEPKR